MRGMDLVNDGRVVVKKECCPEQPKMGANWTSEVFVFKMKVILSASTS